MNKKSLKEIFLLFQGDFLEDIVKFTLQNCKKSAKIKQENSGKLQQPLFSQQYKEVETQCTIVLCLLFIIIL